MNATAARPERNETAKPIATMSSSAVRPESLRASSSALRPAPPPAADHVVQQADPRGREIQEDRQCRSQMERDIEGESELLRVELEGVGDQDEVRRRADRQELRQSLHQAEHERGDLVTHCSPDGRTRGPEGVTRLLLVAEHRLQ